MLSKLLLSQATRLAGLPVAAACPLAAVLLPVIAIVLLEQAVKAHCSET
ncbi:MAG: hypothetical protein V4713_14105 [Pseudomonadota bacterium]